jgi:hypothetical protein
MKYIIDTTDRSGVWREAFPNGLLVVSEIATDAISKIIFQTEDIIFAHTPTDFPADGTRFTCEKTPLFLKRLRDSVVRVPFVMYGGERYHATLYNGWKQYALKCQSLLQDYPDNFLRFIEDRIPRSECDMKPARLRAGIENYVRQFKTSGSNA